MFSELFAKTNYSFLEGASHPEELVQTAAALEYPALGICDKNGVYGIPRCHLSAKTYGLKLIIGAEVFLEGGFSCFLLSKNRNGYGNLCQLLSSIHLNDMAPLSLEFLIERQSDLFLCLPADQISRAPFIKLKEIFNDRFYLVAHSFLDGTDEAQFEIANHHSKVGKVPVLATTQPLFHHRSRKPLQDVLTCIRHRCSLEEAGFRLLPNAERCLKSFSELKESFKSHPEWLETPQRIVEQVHFSLNEIVYHYPNEWLPAGETPNSYLKNLVWKNAHLKYGSILPLKVTGQMGKELSLIESLHYENYFLTIWDILQFAKSKNILFQGRGSAANSVVCYLLGITAIDPIRMEFLFERFISRERAEPPDIDIDFEHERREEVIQYIYQRYGRERAAITAEVICFRRRSAFREVAKVFSLPPIVVQKLLVITHRTSRPQSIPDQTIEEIILNAPGVSRKVLELFYALSTEILSFPRHLGTHVGGFVLCQDLLSRNVPIQKAAMPNRTIIQWDKNDLDNLGFVRVDILGLGILTCLRKTFHLVKTHYEKTFTLDTVPAEDPDVYKSISQGDTIGVFQIESRAQMNMLPRLKPKNFYDLVIEISLVRPGPIQGDLVHPYLRRRQGKEKIEYAHPLLESILKKTCGVPLFQEQIMKMAMLVANFTPGEADELRRAMGSWRRTGKNRLSKMGEKFRSGLIKNGIKIEFADKVFKQIEGFAEYGFPESHAASFAILAYASAYLQHYYPDAYLCGLLNSQPMGFYRIHTLVHHAQRRGVTVLPVHALVSHWDNVIEKPGFLRLGFREVSGLSKKTALAIIRIQTQTNPSSFFDFISKLKSELFPHSLTKRELFCLAMANAFECFSMNRRQALWEIQALPLSDSYMMPEPDPESRLPKEKTLEKIFLDYEGQGVSLHAHPISYFRKFLEGKQALSSKVFHQDTPYLLKQKKLVLVGGLVICRQMPPTASGVLFITLEDEFGFINLVIWKKTYERYREILITQSFLLVQGKIQKAEDANVYHIIVEEVFSLFPPNAYLPSIPSYDFH